MFFHPRRIVRLLIQRSRAFRLSVRCKQRRITFQKGKDITVRKCKIIGKGGVLSIGDGCRIDSVTFYFSGNDSRITVGTDSVLRNSSFWIRNKENGAISIGKKCSLNDTCLGVYAPYGIIDIQNKVTVRGASLGVHGSYGVIDIHNNVTINATPLKKTTFCVSTDRRITVMDDSLLSNSIVLSTTDFHSVYIDSGERVNYDNDIYLGEHVWIGERCYICKGVSIADNNVVGACSVVTKSFENTHTIIAGNPATVKKEGIKWIR